MPRATHRWILSLPANSTPIATFAARRAGSDSPSPARYPLLESTLVMENREGVMGHSLARGDIAGPRGCGTSVCWGPWRPLSPNLSGNYRMFVHNQRLQRLIGGGVFERLGLRAISGVQLLFLGGHKDKEVVSLIRSTRRQRKSLLTAYECFNVYSLARAPASRPGDMAKLACTRGARPD